MRDIFHLLANLVFTGLLCSLGSLSTPVGPQQNSLSLGSSSQHTQPHESSSSSSVGIYDAQPGTPLFFDNDSKIYNNDWFWEQPGASHREFFPFDPQPHQNNEPEKEHQYLSTIGQVLSPGSMDDYNYQMQQQSWLSHNYDNDYQGFHYLEPEKKFANAQSEGVEHVSQPSGSRQEAHPHYSNQAELGFDMQAYHENFRNVSPDRATSIELGKERSRKRAVAESIRAFVNDHLSRTQVYLDWEPAFSPEDRRKIFKRIVSRWDENVTPKEKSQYLLRLRKGLRLETAQAILNNDFNSIRSIAEVSKPLGEVNRPGSIEVQIRRDDFNKLVRAAKPATADALQAIKSSELAEQQRMMAPDSKCYTSLSKGQRSFYKHVIRDLCKSHNHGDISEKLFYYFKKHMLPQDHGLESNNESQRLAVWHHLYGRYLISLISNPCQ